MMSPTISRSSINGRHFLIADDVASQQKASWLRGRRLFYFGNCCVRPSRSQNENVEKDVQQEKQRQRERERERLAVDAIGPSPVCEWEELEDVDRLERKRETRKTCMSRSQRFSSLIDTQTGRSWRLIRCD